MITLGLIIAVVVLVINNRNYLKEINQYREILKKHDLLDELKKSPDNTTTKVEKTKVTPVIEEKKVEAQPIIKEKPKHSDKEIKNSSILIVGSILVILSAIIFLATTWDVTNDIVKAIMLFSMLFVFYAASSIAKKINLEQTYKAFHYITLAYIPLSLLSLWVFKLIGDYFSIDGEGALIYLSACSFFVSAIYYLDSRNKNSKVIGVASIILLLLGVIFIDFKIEARIETFIFSILLVGVIFTLLHRFKYYYISESLNKIGISIVTLSMLYFHVMSSIAVLVFDSPTFLSVINTLIVMYLVYYAARMSNSVKLFNFVYPLLAFLTFLNFTGLIESTFVSQIIMVVSFIVVCLIDFMQIKKLRKVSFYEIVGASTLLYFFTSMENSIPSFIVILVLLLIGIAFYLQDEEKKNYKMYFVSILSYLSLIDIVDYFDLNVIFLGYTALITIVLIKLLNDSRYNPFKYVGYILIFLLSFSLDYGAFGTIIFLSLFAAINLLFSIDNKEDGKFNRIVSYVYLNVIALHITEYVGITEFKDIILLIPICNAIIFIIEMILKDKIFNKVLLYLDYGLSCLILIALNSELIHLILVITNTILLYSYCRINNEDKKYTYVPYIVLIPFVFFGDILTINGINYMNIISILAITAFAYMMFIKEENKYTIFYFIYLILNTFIFDNNKYILLILFAVGSLINYLYRSGKLKDLFKCALYTCGLILTQFIVFDLQINDVAILTYGIYMVYAILVNRTILKKYVHDYKILEYITLVLLNIIAINKFTSETDGLMFVIFLLFVVILSYIKKYGPTFLVSLIFIVINSILLTKEFWLNLPWWLYVLIIGSVLIAFAVINEIKDKKDSSLIIKKLKDDLDL